MAEIYKISQDECTAFCSIIEQLGMSTKVIQQVTKEDKIHPINIYTKPLLTDMHR